MAGAGRDACEGRKDAGMEGRKERGMNGWREGRRWRYDAIWKRSLLSSGRFYCVGVSIIPEAVKG